MDRPQMLSSAMLERALSDPAFKEACPEFSSVQLAQPKQGGCSGCGHRQHQQQNSMSFFKVAAGLSAEGIERMKSYFGISRLMMNVRNPNTSGVSLKVM